LNKKPNVLYKQALRQNWKKIMSISAPFFPDRKLAGTVIDYTEALQHFCCMLNTL